MILMIWWSSGLVQLFLRSLRNKKEKKRIFVVLHFFYRGFVTNLKGSSNATIVQPGSYIKHIIYFPHIIHSNFCFASLHDFLFFKKSFSFTSQFGPFQSFKFDGVKVSSGNKKSTCDFTIVLQAEEIKSIDIECSTRPQKKMTIEIVLTSKTMQKFSLTFTLHLSETKVLSSSVETGPYSSSEYICLQNVSSVPCQLGFTRVCNSDQTTLTSIAICPPGLEEVREEYREKNYKWRIFPDHCGWAWVQLSTEETSRGGSHERSQSPGAW